MPLDLIDGGRHVTRQVLEVTDEKVGDANRPDEAFLVELCKRPPGTVTVSRVVLMTRRESRHAGPVDQIPGLGNVPSLAVRLKSIKLPTHKST